MAPWQLHDDDAVLAQITGLTKSAWSSHRQVLAEFFEIRDGLWHHGRVERERIRIAAKQQAQSNRAKVSRLAPMEQGGSAVAERIAWRCQVEQCRIRIQNQSCYEPLLSQKRKQ